MPCDGRHGSDGRHAGVDATALVNVWFLPCEQRPEALAASCPRVQTEQKAEVRRLAQGEH
jgi:hypothetical protein